MVEKKSVSYYPREIYSKDKDSPCIEYYIQWISLKFICDMKLTSTSLQMLINFPYIFGSNLIPVEKTIHSKKTTDFTIYSKIDRNKWLLEGI